MQVAVSFVCPAMIPNSVVHTLFVLRKVPAARCAILLKLWSAGTEDNVTKIPLRRSELAGGQTMLQPLLAN